MRPSPLRSSRSKRRSKDKLLEGAPLPPPRRKRRSSSLSIEPFPSASIASKSSSARARASLPASIRSTASPTYAATSPRSGVSDMEMITLAVSRFASLASSNPRSSASLKTTNANSPPPARSIAMRIASARVRPKANAPSVKMRPSFAARNATMPESRVGHSCTHSAGSRFAPAVMKKIPRRIPSNGLMSASICCRYRLPASKTPAANAPVVVLSPSACAAPPIPTATSSAAATNVSDERVAATTLKIWRRRTEPAASTAPNPNVALATSTPSSEPPCGPEPATSGKMTSSGATAMSCRSSTASAAVPSARSSHPFCFSTGSTKADEESAPAPARVKATTGVVRMSRTSASSRRMKRSAVSRMRGPMYRLAAVIAAIVRRNCARPKLKKPPSFCSLSGESWRPSVKRRKTIPKSPSCTFASESESKPRPCGPSAQPSARKPSTGVTFSKRQSGTTSTDATRKVKMSLLSASRLMVDALAARLDASATAAPTATAGSSSIHTSPVRAA
mmetsp:Transcript_11648/g.26927  ORF Transcript_11648/g.26927 Transcript_11648/m.26927 type:complete len:507 (-) Transcript_11648:21-1541(-)